MSWRSKLQTITAGSTHETELIATGLAANEGDWIRKLLLEVGFAVGAVVQSTTCPYTAGGASLTPVTTGIAFCYAFGAQPAAVVVVAIVTWFCVAGRWYRSIVSSSGPWAGCGRRASSLSCSSAPITFGNPAGPRTLRTASVPGVGIVDRAIRNERRTGPSFWSPQSRPRRSEQVADACGVLT